MHVPEGTAITIAQHLNKCERATGTLLLKAPNLELLDSDFESALKTSENLMKEFRQEHRQELEKYQRERREKGSHQTPTEQETPAFLA